MRHSLTDLARGFLRRSDRAPIEKSYAETGIPPLTPQAKIERVLRDGIRLLYDARVPKVPLFETRGESYSMLCLVSGAGPHQRGYDVAAPRPGVFFARFAEGEGGQFLFQHEYTWYTPDQFGSVAALLIEQGFSADDVERTVASFAKR